MSKLTEENKCSVKNNQVTSAFDVQIRQRKKKKRRDLEQLRNNVLKARKKTIKKSSGKQKGPLEKILDGLANIRKDNDAETQKLSPTNRKSSKHKVLCNRLLPEPSIGIYRNGAKSSKLKRENNSLRKRDYKLNYDVMKLLDGANGDSSGEEDSTEISNNDKSGHVPKSPTSPKTIRGSKEKADISESESSRKNNVKDRNRGIVRRREESPVRTNRDVSGELLNVLSNEKCMSDGGLSIKRWRWSPITAYEEFCAKIYRENFANVSLSGYIDPTERCRNVLLEFYHQSDNYNPEIEKNFDNEQIELSSPKQINSNNNRTLIVPQIDNKIFKYTDPNEQFKSHAGWYESNVDTGHPQQSKCIKNSTIMLESVNFPTPLNDESPKNLFLRNLKSQEEKRLLLPRNFDSDNNETRPLPIIGNKIFKPSDPNGQFQSSVEWCENNVDEYHPETTKFLKINPIRREQSKSFITMPLNQESTGYTFLQNFPSYEEKIDYSKTPNVVLRNMKFRRNELNRTNSNLKTFQLTSQALGPVSNTFDFYDPISPIAENDDIHKNLINANNAKTYNFLSFDNSQLHSHQFSYPSSYDKKCITQFPFLPNVPQKLQTLRNRPCILKLPGRDKHDSFVKNNNYFNDKRVRIDNYIDHNSILRPFEVMTCNDNQSKLQNKSRKIQISRYLEDTKHPIKYMATNDESNSLLRPRHVPLYQQDHEHSRKEKSGNNVKISKCQSKYETNNNFQPLFNLKLNPKIKSTEQISHHRKHYAENRNKFVLECHNIEPVNNNTWTNGEQYPRSIMKSHQAPVIKNNTVHNSKNFYYNDNYYQTNQNYSNQKYHMDKSHRNHPGKFDDVNSHHYYSRIHE